MQTMPLNAIAPTVKGSAGQAAATDGGNAAAGSTAAEGSDGNAFGALLAKQIKLDLPASQQTLPLDLLKLDTKKTDDDPSQLVQAAAADHVVDPNALAGLVAQALSALNARPSAAPVSTARDGAGLSAKVSTDGTAKEAKDFPLPVAMDAAGKQQTPTEDKAAVIADSGKMLPVAAAKEDVHGRDAKEALPDQFGDKLAAAQQTMAQAAPTRSVSAAAGDVQAGRIDRPVGSPGWGGDLGQKVVWMVGQQKQSAELQLNPPNLGPLEVRLTLNQDQMTATFVSHHAEVRDAIETAMPRLREMLADNGIALGNVMVGAESFAQQQQQQQQAAAQQNGRGSVPEFTLSPSDGDPMAANLPGSVRSAGEGLVNTFV